MLKLFIPIFKKFFNPLFNVYLIYHHMLFMFNSFYILVLNLFVYVKSIHIYPLCLYIIYCFLYSLSTVRNILTI